jgi:hypothetical protein
MDRACGFSQGGSQQRWLLIMKFNRRECNMTQR